MPFPHKSIKAIRNGRIDLPQKTLKENINLNINSSNTGVIKPLKVYGNYYYCGKYNIWDDTVYFIYVFIYNVEFKGVSHYRNRHTILN